VEVIVKDEVIENGVYICVRKFFEVFECITKEVKGLDVRSSKGMF